MKLVIVLDVRRIEGAPQARGGPDGVDAEVVRFLDGRTIDVRSDPERDGSRYRIDVTDAYPGGEG